MSIEDENRPEGEIEETELPDYGEYDERGENEGEFVDAEGHMMEASFDNAQGYSSQQERQPGLTWGPIDHNDIKNKDVLVEDDDEEYVGANRRDGVYVEGNKKFRFRANLEDFLIKQNYKGAGEQDDLGEEGEGEVEDQTELIERRYHKFRNRFTIVVLGIFGFLKGILAGMGFLAMLIIFITGNYREDEFLENYEPLAPTFSKLFILGTTICFVCSVTVINAKCWTPGTSSFQKMNMLLEGIAYFVIVCCCFLCAIADDYFSSHDVVEEDTQALKSFFYLWQVFNGLRCVLAILTYLGGTLCSLSS